MLLGTGSLLRGEDEGKQEEVEWEVNENKVTPTNVLEETVRVKV